MKYIRKILLLAVLLVAVSIQDSYATKGNVTIDGVRVRKGPSTDTEIVTILNQSATVEIIEESGDWYKIKYTESGNYEGYMSKQFVKKEGSENIPTQTTMTTPVPTPTPVATPTAQATPTTVKTQEPTIEPSKEPELPDTHISLGDKATSADTRVYVLPTVASTIKDTVKKNTTVSIQEIAGNFAYIKYNNQYGWVRVSALQEVTQTEPVQTTTNTTKVGYVNVTQAIIRSKATTSSEMVTSLNFNAEVTIIGEESDFYKIKINGKEAYIAKRLISDTKQQTTNRSSEPRQEATTTVNTQKKENTVVTETKKEVTAEVKNEVTNNVPSSSTGDQMAQMAKSYVGYKYVYGGASPSTGFDCSGLVYYICGQLGYSVNRTADYQVNNGVPVEKSNLQPGDLVFFTNYKTNQGIGHVGIYIGNNQFVHASTATTGVITSSLNEATYVKRYVTARRLGV